MKLSIFNTRKPADSC